MSYRMEVVSNRMRIGRAPGGLDIEMTESPHSFYAPNGVDEAYVTSIWIPDEHVSDLREWLARHG